MTRRRMATGVLLLCAGIVLSCYPARFTFWGGFGVHTALAALVRRDRPFSSSFRHSLANGVVAAQPRKNHDDGGNDGQR